MKNNILKTALIFCALIAFCTCNTIYAQAMQISTATVMGQVINDDLKPLQGIVVKAFNSKKEAVTDLQGNFSIEISANETDYLSVNHEGYKSRTIEVSSKNKQIVLITLEKSLLIDGSNSVDLPYRTLTDDHNVSAVTTITGEELSSCPSVSILDALSGRIPGLVINPYSNIPGQEYYAAYLRGSGVTIYIDGVMRDITGFSPEEIDKVQVIKDLSGRAMLGLSGTGPVLWITTKKGTGYNKEIKVSAEYGISTPTTLPKFLNSFDYATLLNEALTNDGLTKWYTETDLTAYKNHTDLINYPDVDYYKEYVEKTTPFRRANVSFSGGDKRVTYFSMFDYTGNQGLETIGEKIENDRYKLRGNVDIKLADFIRMSVNISASLNKQRYPNVGDGSSVFNMFDYISVYPSNAHPIYFEDKLIRSDNFPVNITNELESSGFAEGTLMNAQNNAKLIIDLGSVVKGLSFTGSASFDVSNSIYNCKGGTAALYRLHKSGSGDVAERVVEAYNDVDMSVGDFIIMRRTAAYGGLNYDRQFGKGEFTSDATFFAGMEEYNSNDNTYQPSKVEDLTYRANYTYDKRYVAQVDLAYSGSNRLPEDKRFSLYPTAGLAWIASNESFLKDNRMINYLKLHGSWGIMGVNDYYLQGYNPFYLQETLWTLSGYWTPGIAGNVGNTVNYYTLLQTGSNDFVLPKKRYLNIGLQTRMLNNALSVELNYFNEKNYDKISNKAATTPTIIGSEKFLPAVNYGEDRRWGLEGMVQYTKQEGDFTYSIGANAMYMRSKYLVVDEPDALEDYKKLKGTEMDAFWLYESEGLYQSQSEITNRGVSQSWGDVIPGDIRYADINNDKVINENDIHATDYHSPRFYYGINFSVGYKRVGLHFLGQGAADGNLMLNNRYFQARGTAQNYSEPMLDRYPYTNDYPRLTTVSENNYQSSTFWVANAAFFRIKNVELTYSLPATMAQKLTMSDIKIFARGTNLAVFSELNKYHVDPEMINAGVTTYPLFRTVTAGISCKF